MSSIVRDTLITLRNTLIKNHKAELELLDKQIKELDGEESTTPSTLKSTNEYVDNAVYALEDSDARATARKRIRNTNALVTINGIDGTGIIFDEYNTKTLHTSRFKITANMVYGFIEFLNNTVTLNTGSFLTTLLSQARAGRKTIKVHSLYQTGFVIINVTGMEIGTVGRPVTYYFPATEVSKLPYETRRMFNLP